MFNIESTRGSMLRLVVLLVFMGMADGARAGFRQLESLKYVSDAAGVRTASARRTLLADTPDVVATEVLIAPAGAPAHVASISGDANYLPVGPGGTQPTAIVADASSPAIRGSAATTAAAPAAVLASPTFRTPASLPSTRSLDLVALNQEAIAAGHALFTSSRSPPPPPGLLLRPQLVPVAVVTATTTPAATAKPAVTPAPKPTPTTATAAPAAKTTAAPATSGTAATKVSPVPVSATAAPASAATAAASSASAGPTTTVVVLAAAQTSPPPVAMATSLYSSAHPHAFGLSGRAFWAVLILALLASTAITAWVIFKIRAKHGLLFPPLRGRRNRGASDPRHWMDFENDDPEYGATKLASRSGLATTSGNGGDGGAGGGGWGGGWGGRHHHGGHGNDRTGHGNGHERHGRGGSPEGHQGDNGQGHGNGHGLGRGSGDSRGDTNRHHSHRHAPAGHRDHSRERGSARRHGEGDRDLGRPSGGGDGSLSDRGSSDMEWGDMNMSGRNRGRRARRHRREREAQEKGMPTLRKGRQERAPPWEEMYKQSPEACTQNAKQLLEDVRHGRKVLCERSWKGEVGGGGFGGAGAKLLKVCIFQERRGVIVTFGEKLFGPTKHVVERASTRVDNVGITLETDKGLAMLWPGDWASRATLILALNACFHRNAVDTVKKWGIGDADLDGPAIGLPWHPSVTLEPRLEEVPGKSPRFALPPPGAGVAPGASRRKVDVSHRAQQPGSSGRGGVRRDLATASGGGGARERSRREGGGMGAAAEYWEEDRDSSGSDGGGGRRGGGGQQRSARVARPTTPPLLSPRDDY